LNLARTTGIRFASDVVFGNKDVKNRMRNPVDGVAKEKLGELLAFPKGSS